MVGWRQVGRAVLGWIMVGWRQAGRAAAGWEAGAQEDLTVVGVVAG